MKKNTRTNTYPVATENLGIEEIASPMEIAQAKIKVLKQENANLKEAMDVIRFLAFKYEVQYWNDATGTDAEKLGSILRLAREANWKREVPQTQEIKLKHLL